LEIQQGKHNVGTPEDESTKYKMLTLKSNITQCRTTVDAMSEAVFLIDLDHKILLCNKAALEILGKTDFNEIIGHKCYGLVHGTTEQVDWCPVSKMRSSGNRETIIRKLNGRWMEISANPVYDDNDSQLIGAVHIITDITAKKQVEDALRESEEKNKNILNNLVDPILIIDLSGKFIYSSPQIFNLTGYKPEEIIGKNYFSFIHPDDLNNAIKTLKNALEKKERVYLEYRTLHKDGHYIHISASGKIIKTEGEDKILTVISDISERIKTAIALKKEKDFTETAINAQRDTFFILDPSDGKAIRWNRAFREISGYSDEEISTMKAPDSYYDENDLNKAALAIEKTIQGEESLVELKLITKDGRKIPFEYLASTINDIEGNLKYIISIGRDISDKIKIEQELRESEEKYRVLFDSSPFAVGLIDMTGKIIDINRVHEIGAGYSKKDLIGKPFTELSVISEKYLPLVAKEFKNLIKNGTSEPQEIQVYDKDGSLMWIYLYASLIKLGNKTVIQVISQNITTVKEAERKLKESMEKYRILFETSPNSILLVDLNGVILDCNPSTENTFGYKRDALIGKTFTELGIYKQEHLNNLIKSFRDKINGKEVDPLEIQIKKKNNEESWVYVQSSLIKSGNQTLIQGIIQDITEKKEAEQELIKLSKIKSELLRRTSHELKTPLVSIKGFSSLLLELYKDKLDDYVLSTIGEINQGCIRLENLIRDILKSAELDTKSVQLKKTEEDLSFLIRFCVNELRGFIKLRNHTVDLQIHDEIITSFEKEQTHQVLSNLLTNAIKYTPINGKIEIKSAIKDEMIQISIKDNGIGFTMEEKERLFEQFGKIERYGQGLDIVSDGSGLGLYISKKIVELHGGTIWVESEGRNKGSTFYFTLPIILE